MRSRFITWSRSVEQKDVNEDQQSRGCTLLYSSLSNNPVRTTRRVITRGLCSTSAEETTSKWLNNMTTSRGRQSAILFKSYCFQIWKKKRKCRSVCWINTYLKCVPALSCLRFWICWEQTLLFQPNHLQLSRRVLPWSSSDSLQDVGIKCHDQSPGLGPSCSHIRRVSHVWLGSGMHFNWPLAPAISRCCIHRGHAQWKLCATVDLIRMLFG